MTPHRLLTLSLMFAASNAFAQVEFRLAYRTERAETEPAVFANDSMFRFMSKRPFIASSELLGAQAEVFNGSAFVSIKISSATRQKVNALAAANVEAQHRGAFEEHVALAVVADGMPRQVIQGVFRPLTENTLWWSLGGTDLSAKQDLLEAQSWAKRINDAKP